ncbi:MAG: methyltransferase domain-containing protein [Anaerolineales bacterium]|nr:methyltransferase domain-containing protein [Anaerolineales bacterium]
MSEPPAFSFPRYLRAKKSVDDRALNRYVWEAMSSALPAQTPDRPLRILEVAGGIGTMLQRIVEWGLVKYARYTLVDIDPKNITSAREYLTAWGTQAGFSVTAEANRIVFADEDRKIELALHIADIFAFIQEQDQEWDLVAANAFLDLVDLKPALTALFASLAPRSHIYATINYDGLTIFEPVIDQEFDAEIARLYNQTMDARIVAGKPSGDSQTGRHLFTAFGAAGFEVLAAGSSDWVVHSQAGRYPQDEAYFLHCIIQMVGQALGGHPTLDQARLQDWLRARRAQIEQGELVYVAHQIDYLVRKP